MKIQFWFVRHGETLFNQKGRIQGICDSPLTENGKKQIQKTVEALKNQTFDRIISSPLGRAQQTAEMLNETRHQDIELLDDLKEVCFGRVQGSRETSHIDQLRECMAQDDFTSIGGENLRQIETRIDHAFRAIRETSTDGDRVLIIGHGSMEQYLMSHLLGVDFKKFEEERLKERRSPIPNAGIMTFTYENGKYRIQTLPIEPERYEPSEEKKTVHFYYVRHGECDFNVWSRMQGWTDSPLTENGLQQAVITSDALAREHFDRIYCSPLGRAWYTGQIIAERHPETPVYECAGLKENFVGDFEGVVTNDWKDEIHERHITRGWQDVGGESLEEIASRIRHTLEEIIRDVKDDETVLLVSHGNYYMSLLFNLFGIERDTYFQQARSEGRQATPNGGIARFDWDGDHFELISKMLSPEEYWNAKRGM